MMRAALVALVMLVLAQGCADHDSAQVAFAMPKATRQALTGFDATGRAVVKLEVVCDDGRGGSYEQELATRVDSVGFFVPPCGQATLSLTISSVFDDEDPVEAFASTAPAFLERGKNTDVEFTGIAYGELVLDPLGQPLTHCTVQDTGSLYPLIDVDMSAGRVETRRVPAADYDIYCYDALSTFPNYQPTHLSAGQRSGPDLTLGPDSHVPGGPPVLRDIAFYNVRPDSVFVSWGFTTSAFDSITFSLVIAYDAGLTDVAQAPIVGDQGQVAITGLAPQTHYYVQVSANDANGSSNLLTGEFDTPPESLNALLSDLTIDGVTISGFVPTTYGYPVTASFNATDVNVSATTDDPNALVHIDSDAETTHVAGAVVPIGSPGTFVHIYIYVRTYDGLTSQSYDVLVYRDSG